MGLFKKKRKITIEQIEGKKCIIKCDCIMETGEVCDMLLGALCMALKCIAKQSGVSIDIYKKAAISEIQKLENEIIDTVRSGGKE